MSARSRAQYRGARVWRECVTRSRDFALGLPEASEDHPWGEDVAKVGGKIFVFLGSSTSKSRRMTVKLDESHAHALAIDGAEPTGTGWDTRAGSPSRSGRRESTSRSCVTGSRRAIASSRRSDSSHCSTTLLASR